LIFLLSNENLTRNARRTEGEKLMLDAAPLIEHWGYWAIFGIVVLGNLGFPVPEEGILVFAGYLVWAGKLRLFSVLAVGVIAAAVGDNLGYWMGRHYGQGAIRRFGHKIFITEERFDKARQIVGRYGSYGVFVARFIPGLRFMAGPVAGSTGFPFLRFFIANLLGGLVYVPLSIGAGYFLGKSLADVLRHIEGAIGDVEHLALVLLVFTAIVIVIWRALNSRNAQGGRSES
jgi:membrane protein DedA with SNARE-associated domain